MDSKPYFSDEILIYWKDYKKQFVEPFLIKINILEDQEVNLDLCIGTSHPSYINKTWYDLYHGGLQRGESNIKAMKRNPDYYLSTERKEYLSFVKHETKYFIGVGNHRTIIGRHYLHSQKKEEIIKGVSVVEYITDKYFFTVYQEITRDQKLDVSVLRKNLDINREKEGEVMLLISSLDNQHTILFTKRYAKSLLSDTTVYGHAGKLQNESEEQLISQWILKILKLPYIFNKLFFSFFEDRNMLVNNLSSNIWLRYPSWKKAERLYYAEDIQNSKIIKKLAKLLSYMLSYR